MDAILHNLNTAQKDAVTSPAHVLQILAPPGSGKTKTLTSRVAYLLSYHHYQPWNIVCLTFTIKSAREMKGRIAAIFNDGLEKRLILGTFHSVCRRYLASYGHLIGIRNGFGIADSSDSLSIIKRICKRFKLNLDPKKAQGRVSSSKSKGGVIQWPNKKVTEKNLEQQEFAILSEAYQSQLEKSNLLDYDDLLLRCADLLRLHPSCVSNIEAVLIDEFQDTNRVQFELMQLFASKNKRITIVGDPDQSIYGWRAAEIKNLKRMQAQYPNTLVINLEDNYRSAGAILHAAQEVIEQDEARPQKSLAATHDYGSMPVLRRLPSPEVEAAWIVSEIQRSEALTGGLLEHADFAILLRYAALSRNIEAALGKAGIPYRMVGGQRFFDREEIKVLLGYLRVISQSSNSDALSYIIDKPPRGAGATTIKSLLEEAESSGTTMWILIRDAVRGHKKPQTRISKAAEQGLSALINVILTVKARIADMTKAQSPKDILDYVLQKVDIEGWLKKKNEEDFEVTWANVEELLAQADQFSDDAGSIGRNEDILPDIEDVEQATSNPAEEALSKFLANVALATEIQREDDRIEGGSNPQSRITISTIHAAKGLEWPVVFVPSVYDGSIPLSRSEDHDEERRLLYVAMTRAKALLSISYPLKSPQREDTTMSRFLTNKKVIKTLSEKGPSYKVSMVKSIAQILQREPPSDQSIFEGCNKVESQEDDLWPLNGEVDPEVAEQLWNRGGDSYHAVQSSASYKRRKLASGVDSRYALGTTVSLVSASTTMQNAASFTLQAGIGFTTATSEMRRLKEEKLIVEKRGSLESSSKVKAKPSNKASKLTIAGQADLKTLWGAQSAPKLPGLTAVAPKADGTLLRHSTMPPDAPSPKAIPTDRPPLATIPPNPLLSSHYPFKTPRPTFSHPQISAIVNDEENEQPNPYIFLSSSPPEPSNDDGELGPKPLSGVTTQMTPLHSKPDIKPATTIFHSTSISQFQQQKTTKMNDSAMISRRTLGVKRNMTSGWRPPAAQTCGRVQQQGFSVPKRTKVEVMENVERSVK